MTDPIPQPIYKSIILWLLASKERKEPCQVRLHVNTEGKIVKVDRVREDHVTFAS